MASINAIYYSIVNSIIVSIIEYATGSLLQKAEMSDRRLHRGGVPDPHVVRPLHKLSSALNVYACSTFHYHSIAYLMCMN